MLEKIKEVPFIDESSAVRLKVANGMLELERNDRVVWASERTQVPAQDVSCYVEADKFFALLPDIQSVRQTTCLEATLKNGAKYELPLLEASWESEEMPDTFSDTITFKLSDLMLCTLKNLIKPELQCIYIDSQGAVSCDFMSACINNSVKSTTPFLLPPDVQDLVDGRLCKVQIEGDKLYIQASDFNIVTTKPTMSEDAWWEDLRAMLAEVSGFTFSEPLVLALKRLALFGDYISFSGDRVIGGTNFEPFQFENLGDNQYEIERMQKILGSTTHISVKTGNLVLKNESSLFLVSPMEEA